MDGLVTVMIVFLGCDPALLEHLGVANFVEDSVTYK